MVELSAVVLQASAGILLGAVIGYAIRKASGVILTVIGLYATSLVALAYAGIIALNWEGLANIVSSIINWLGMQSSDVISFLSSAGVFGASLTAGLLFGGFLNLFSVEEPKRKKKFVRKKA
jgi:uncharacterized membrane protein (Fun14 family)